jgi:hypothetical protein
LQDCIARTLLSEQEAARRRRRAFVFAKEKGTIAAYDARPFRRYNVCHCSAMFDMRIAKTISITLPPELLLKAQAIAQRENRTMSELFREALRQYKSPNPEWEALKPGALNTATRRESNPRTM